MKLFVFTLFIMSQTTLFAQNGEIHVQQDSRIDVLMQKQLNLNASKHGVDGFRVQIHFGQSRETAQKIRSRFSIDFPELKTYLGYNSPYYKIRVGDFITRLEAYKVQKAITKKYRGAYIVPTTVDFEAVTKKESL
jgi:hypothetical protein